MTRLNRFPQLGLRLLFGGWLALMVLVLAGLSGAQEMVGRFEGRMITVRGWMAVYNSVVLAAHLVVLIPLLVGTVLLWRHEREASGSRSLLGATVLLGGAVAAVTGMLIFPLILGSGPWPPNAIEVRLLRALVFAPTTLRALAWLLLALTLMRWAGGARTWWYAALVALAAINGAFVAYAWWVTPYGVVARLHPLGSQPLALAGWLAGGALFLLALQRQLRRPLAPAATA